MGSILSCKNEQENEESIKYKKPAVNNKSKLCNDEDWVDPCCIEPVCWDFV